MNKKLINILLCGGMLLLGIGYANPSDQSTFMKYYGKISKSKPVSSGCLANCVNTITGGLYPSPKNYIMFGYAFQKYLLHALVGLNLFHPVHDQSKKNMLQLP